MSGRDRLAIPTLKLREEDLIRAAREADARAREADAASRDADARARAPSARPGDAEANLASTRRPPPPEAEVEVEVRVEALDAGLDGLLAGSQLEGDLAASAAESGPLHNSDVRPVWRPEDGPDPASVPCVVVSKEDLSWFELEATSDVVLALIDGVATVGEIVERVTIPRDHALAILRELKSHGVVEFH